MTGRFFGNFLVHAAIDGNEFCARAVPSIRFEGLTFPIIRAATNLPLTTNGTSRRVRLHDTQMSLFAAIDCLRRLRRCRR